MRFRMRFPGAIIIRLSRVHSYITQWRPLFLPILLGGPDVLIVRFSDPGSNPESGPNSPPTVNNSQASPTAGSNTAIQEVSFDSTVYVATIFRYHVPRNFTTRHLALIYCRKVKIRRMEDVSLAVANRVAFRIFRSSVHRPCLTSRWADLMFRRALR